MKHRVLVQIALFLWIFCVTRLAFAVTYAQEVKSFDYESLVVAGASGLLGGVLRTIFTLANDNRVVFSVIRESRGDLVVSCIAGAVAYGLMIAVESKFPGLVTREIRFVGVMAAGWLGKAFFSGLQRFSRAKMDNAVHQARGGAPKEAPTSAIVPLTDTPKS